MGTVGRDVILHVLIMDPSDNLSNLLVFRDILYVEMTITKVIVLVHNFGIKVTFTHDRTFSRIFLLNSNITGVLVVHDGSLQLF